MHCLEQFASTVIGRHEMTTPQGSFYDALTGETVVRDLTEEEIASLPEASSSNYESATQESSALEEEAEEA